MNSNWHTASTFLWMIDNDNLSTEDSLPWEKGILDRALTSFLRKALSAMHLSMVGLWCREPRIFRRSLLSALHSTAMAPWATAYMHSEGSRYYKQEEQRIPLINAVELLKSRKYISRAHPSKCITPPSHCILHSSCRNWVACSHSGTKIADQ